MNFLGEALSLIAALLLAYSTFSKKKKNMIVWQALDVLFCSLANLVLGGYSAVVTNFLSLFVSLLVIKNKLDEKNTIILCILMIVVGLYFNNRAWLGILPIIATVQYTICLYLLKTAQQMRIAIMVNLVPWLVFDFAIKSYPIFMMDIIIIIASMTNYIRYINFKEQTDS